MRLREDEIFRLRVVRAIVDGLLEPDEVGLPAATVGEWLRRYRGDPRLSAVVPISRSEIGLPDRVIETLISDPDLAAEVVSELEGEED